MALEEAMGDMMRKKKSQYKSAMYRKFPQSSMPFFFVAGGENVRPSVDPSVVVSNGLYRYGFYPFNRL